MNPREEDTQTLTQQLTEWSSQISNLTERQQAATATAKKLLLELEELRAKHRAATLQLRKRENKSSAYIWENIGDGG